MKVYATSENIRDFITHWPSGVKFNKDGWADWPEDQWLKRRLRDGDISLEPPKEPLKPQVSREERIKQQLRMLPPKLLERAAARQRGVRSASEEQQPPPPKKT
jgi:hypothetical protein